ncbi:MAG: hypothetical protein Q9166_006011 [cf. Caloplaca sp. 2 TL-2023]
MFLKFSTALILSSAIFSTASAALYPPVQNLRDVYTVQNVARDANTAGADSVTIKRHLHPDTPGVDPAAISKRDEIEKRSYASRFPGDVGVGEDFKEKRHLDAENPYEGLIDDYKRGGDKEKRHLDADNPYEGLIDDYKRGGDKEKRHLDADNPYEGLIDDYKRGG